MTPTMETEQRLRWERDGFLVVPNALSAAELAQTRAAAERAEAAWRADRSRPGKRGPDLEQVQAILEYDDAFLDLLDHPNVFPVARELLGDDVSLIDHDFFITPPRQRTHADWHHDEWLRGVHHPGSTMMVKAFWLLSDVPPGGGGTAMVPGSYRFPPGFEFPKPDDPKAMPGAVPMAHPAGTAYLMHGHTYHCALNNETDQVRRVIIINYGHFWMKPWQGYEPSERLKVKAATPERRQLLHVGEAYAQHL